MCLGLHAYLHRVEGDFDNARYWYRQARRPPATGELADEWAAIAGALLSGEPYARLIRRMTVGEFLIY